MATTFHYFPLLPWELRSHIWKLTVEPRIVDVEIKRKDVENPFTYYKLPPKAWLEEAPHKFQAGVPVALQSNYTLRLRSRTPVPAPLQACREVRNLGLYKEFSDVGDQVFPGYFGEDVASTIQRLRIRTETRVWDNAFRMCFFSMCSKFNLKEVQVVCEEGFYPVADGQVVDHPWWPCTVIKLL
ncbi:hypothetical protein B0T20DRAFT_206937 [Sordaria brevicollis]|uniref:2EXR domain-containing protein n=1 Tax=Sordaria brevicollis TaxID=83679 RepID=A0AAE0PEK7_SORBR|nr:hypothetical protein B0T20DRAFT_206937 [Sordaria brevicollis]